MISSRNVAIKVKIPNRYIYFSSPGWLRSYLKIILNKLESWIQAQSSWIFFTETKEKFQLKLIVCKVLSCMWFSDKNNPWYNDWKLDSWIRQGFECFPTYRPVTLYRNSLNIFLHIMGIIIAQFCWTLNIYYIPRYFKDSVSIILFSTYNNSTSQRQTLRLRWVK